MNRDGKGFAGGETAAESKNCSERVSELFGYDISLGENDAKSGGESRRAEQTDEAFRKTAASAANDAPQSDAQKVIDDIERRETALRRAERQFAEAQRVANLGSWVFNRADKTVTWSDELFHILGCQKGEVEPKYKTYLRLVHPDDRSFVVGQHRRAMRERGSYRHEHRLLLPSGEIRYLDTYGAAIADDNGNVIKITGTAQDITPRKSAEANLRENDEWLQAIFDASRDGIMVECNGVIKYVNNAYAQMFGYETSENLRGRLSADLIAPDDAERMTEYGRARLRGESAPPVYAFQGRRRDGGALELEAAVSTCVISGRDCIISVVRDIAARNRVARLVEESEKRYRSLCEGIMHQVWTSLPDGRLDYANQRALDYFGKTGRRLLGDNWLDVVHPDDAAECRRRWTHSLAAGEDYVAHFRLRRADGEYLWHEARASAGRDADGEIFKWFGTNTDINDQKLAEESLRQSEERFQLAARASNDLMWEWDVLTDELWWNETTATAFGHSVENEEDKVEFWRALIHKEDIEAIQASIYEFIASDEEFWTGEYRIQRADGTHATIVDRRMVVRDEHGRATRMFGSALDISERREAEKALLDSEERLLHSQKMEAIGTLTGGVAHDFNNLLTAIIGNTQLALLKLDDDDPLRARLTEIEKASSRAAVLTRQLLIFSRRQHLERRTVNLNETISEIMKLLERIIGEDVELAVDCAPDLAAVFADPAQFEQVVMNLCVNAREAMPHGGRISIKTTNFAADERHQRRNSGVKPGKYVRITISDNGGGMDKPTRARIFEPFFTTKSVGKGTGLGLSIAYGIVNQHGGTITVDSEPGCGATFEIFLPVDEKAIENEQQTIPLSLFGGTETILVAEDEEALRSLAKDILGKLGYTVLLAKNGEEALEIYRANRDRIDLLLFDSVMPRMSGAEAYQRIKDSGGDVPLIFVTGYSDEMTQNRFLRQNESTGELPRMVIQKPYDVRQLGHKIREALDARLKR